MEIHPLRLDCFGPYSFYDEASVPCTLRSEHAKSKGVYLWTLPFGDIHRLNYIGKTSNRTGFVQRFRQELRFAKCGKKDRGNLITAPIVDCARWFKGERVVTNPRPSAEETARAWPEMERTYHALNVFLVPIEGDDVLRARVESAIAGHLKATCEACRRLMCPIYPRKPPQDSPRLLLETRFPVGVTVCGLEAPITERDWSGCA
jgi:hypothetical protein